MSGFWTSRPVKWIVDFIQRLRADGCTGLAGMIAYNFFLALPTFLIFLVTVLAFLPIEDVVSSITDQLSGIMPADALSLLTRILERTLERGRGSIPVLAASFFGTLYVMNNAYAGIIGSLNRIFHFKETRPWLKVRLHALVMSIVSAAFLIAAFAFVIVVPLIVHDLSADQGFNQTVGLWLSRLRWPAIAIFALLGIENTYRWAPDGHMRIGFVSPGTLVAAGSWLGATLAFGYYVNNYSSYQNVYGGLGSVIVLMTWMWMTAMVFLTGAEINMAWRDWRESRLRHPEQVTEPAPDV